MRKDQSKVLISYWSTFKSGPEASIISEVELMLMHRQENFKLGDFYLVYRFKCEFE